MRPLLPSVMLLTLAPLLAGGCVKTSSPSLEQQIASNEQAIRQLNSQLSGVQPAQADTWSQVQALRQEVAALRGDIDNLLYSLQSVGGAHQMADSLLRHDQALHQIENQMALDLQLDKPVLPPAPVQTMPQMPLQTTGQSSAMMNTAVAGQLPSAPTEGASAPLNGMAAGAAVAGTAVAGTGIAAGSAVGGSPAGGNSSVADIQSPAPAAPVTPQYQPEASAVQQPAQPQARPDASSTAQALYDAGLASFNARNYEQALRSFKDFARVYPQHQLVSNAWFWQGESSWQLGRYAEAALSYEKVISGFPNSVKAPDSYFKQAMCFLNLNKKAAAKQRFSELIKKYPKAPQARRAEQIIKEKKL